MNQPDSEAAHISALDGVRAIAILLVMFYHFTKTLPLETPADKFLLSYGHCAWFGVDLFFVLSGFLITGILLKSKEGKRFFIPFFARRGLRIWPLYYGFLFLFFIVLPLVGIHLIPQAEQCAPWFWLNCQNFRYAYFGWRDMSVSVLWSLALEEQFYITWPFFVRFFREKTLAIGLTILIVSTVLVRAYLFAHHYSTTFIYTHPLARLDSIAIGCLLAILCRTKVIVPQSLSLARQRVLTGIFVAGVMVLLVVRPDWESFDFINQVPMFTLIGLIGALLIVLGTASERGSALRKFLEHPWMGHVAKVSYGTYIIHRTVELLAIGMLWPYFKTSVPLIPGTVYVILMSLVSIAIATVLFHCYEKPILGLKKYFEYERSKD